MGGGLAQAAATAWLACCPRCYAAALPPPRSTLPAAGCAVDVPPAHTSTFTLVCHLPIPAPQLHPEHGFDQDARRRCLLAAVLLPVADVQVPAAKGKPVRCASASGSASCAPCTCRLEAAAWAAGCRWGGAWPGPPGQQTAVTCEPHVASASCTLRPATPTRSAAFHAVREGLKWKAKDAEAVDALHATAPELVAVYRQLCGQPDVLPGGWPGWAGWALLVASLAGCRLPAAHERPAEACSRTGFHPRCLCTRPTIPPTLAPSHPPTHPRTLPPAHHATHHQPPRSCACAWATASAA